MINLKLVEQSNNYNCGTAALESLLSFYGINYDHEKLEVICDSSSELGTSPEGLMKGIRSLNLEPIEESPSTWEKLIKHIENNIPVIVEWYSDFIEPGDGHYSVVADIDNENIFLMDPEIGKIRKIPKDDFIRRWNHSEPAGWSLYIKN